MGQEEVTLVNRKINSLYKYIFNEKGIEEYQKETDITLDGKNKKIPYCVFFSICNMKTRASVCHGTGESLEIAWENAAKNAEAWAKRNAVAPEWVKAEIMYKADIVPAATAVNEIFRKYNYFFRRGLSLDREMKYSFTEGELNGNDLLAYREKYIDIRTLNEYIMQRDYDVFFGKPTEFVMFDCRQYLADEKNELFTLYSDGLNCGRRITDTLTKKDIYHLITTSSKYLADQIKKDGSFEYGFYPLKNSAIPTYNILRHTSSLWSLVGAVSLNYDAEMLNKTQAAFRYMFGELKQFDGFTCLVDKTPREIKLGGNAIAIISLTQYMLMTGTKDFIDICCELGEGILEMMDPETGIFTHVYSYPSLEAKEEFRTVYYDGEAAFALTRLYSLTRDEAWLDAARLVVDRFIREDYTKYRDHWVAYAVNELTMYDHSEKYFEFGLRNVQENLKTIHDQATTYHTYLELLMASFDMYMRIIDEGREVSYLKKFDEKAFLETIIYRAKYMLNGYGYPEYVMYFEKPYYFEGSFFIRHDAYRTRIDDVQHFCGAYIALYKDFDRVNERYTQLTGKNLQN